LGEDAEDDGVGKVALGREGGDAGVVEGLVAGGGDEADLGAREGEQ
jgi:hypothetical protein